MKAGFSYISQMLRKVRLFFLMALLSVGCTKVSDDTKPPEIFSYTINGSSFVPGEFLEVSVSAGDNEELNQIRVRVDEAFSKSFGFWKLIDVRNVSGTTYSSTLTYMIPDTTLAGLYEVSFQVVDERGNGSVDSTLQFAVRREDDEPMIAGFNTDPAIGSDNVLRLFSSDTLTFSGTISDPDSLQSFTISFRDGAGKVLRTVEYAVADCTVFDLNWDQDTVFFQTFEEFPIEMLLKAQDNPGHQRRISYPVEVN